MLSNSWFTTGKASLQKAVSLVMIIFYNKRVMRYNICGAFIINFVTTTSDYIFSYSMFVLVHV